MIGDAHADDADANNGGAGGDDESWPRRASLRVDTSVRQFEARREMVSFV